MARWRFVAAFVLMTSGLAVARQSEAPPAPGPATPLFDGKTLAGWDGNSSIWRVEDGAITGGSLTETVKVNEFLATTREFSDFIVRFQIKLTGQEGFINSGFQIRSQRVPNSSEMIGIPVRFRRSELVGRDLRRVTPQSRAVAVGHDGARSRAAS